MASSGGATDNSYSSCKLNNLIFECTELLNWFGDDIRYNGKVVSEEDANDFIHKKTSNIADLYWKSIYDFNDIQVTPNIKVILNGNTLTFEQQPYIENGTTRVPMRKIFESLGATVEYDANTKTITARKGSTIIELATGVSTAKINGREMTLTASVENKNGSTMVPLRFVSEALGAEVIWDADTRTITIDYYELSDEEKLTSAKQMFSNFFKGNQEFLFKDEQLLYKLMYKEFYVDNLSGHIVDKFDEYVTDNEVDE